MSHVAAGKTTDVIPLELAQTLSGLFRERVRRSPDAIAYRQFDPRTRHWEDTRWSEMAESVARWQAAMLREGLARGDRVAVMLRNCREWVMFDQAAHGLGLVVVPRKQANQIQLLVVDSRNATESWPVGWPSEKPERELVPKLFEFLPVEIENVVLSESLEAVRGRLDLVLVSHPDRPITAGVLLRVCGDALWRWGLRGMCTALAASAHGAEVGESGWAWHDFPPMGPAARMRK